MRRKRTLLLLVAVAVLAGSLFIRVGYQSLGWGGYVYIKIVKPWTR